MAERAQGTGAALAEVHAESEGQTHYVTATSLAHPLEKFFGN